MRIDQRRWNRTLLPQLETLRAELGLPEGSRLKAELHSLLLYEPGQFFAPHQDSEKADDMVGSLVVLLPSAAKGGALVVEHRGEKSIFRGSATKLTFVAFYADCRHEVRPVREGSRLALTYNLVSTGEGAEPPVEAHQVEALKAAVDEYFRTPRDSSWSHDEGTSPERLVYLLDHEYTRRRLGWNRLKGADGARVAALRQVAEDLDCGAMLALADVHETWQCEDDDEGYGRYRWRRRRDDDDDDEDEDEGDGAHDLVDLIDCEISLSHCLGSDPGRAQIAEGAQQEEVCSTTGADDLEPYAYEHEGYMGNYGNTVDRWYHRAAVVLWPRSRSFVLRAQASARWALGEVAKTLKAGDLEAARRLAESLLPFWASVAASELNAGFAARACQVAASLEAPELAATLVKPLWLERLTPASAPGLGALAQGYGLPWCRACLSAWDKQRTWGEGPDRKTWLAGLPELCRRLCAQEGEAATDLARELVAGQCAWVRQEWEATCAWPHPAQRLEALGRLAAATLAVTESSLVVGRADLHAGVLAHLAAPETGSPVLALTGLLRAAHGSRKGQALPTLGLEGLHRHCAETLSRRLAMRPAPRATGRSSRRWRATASCARG